jgi:CopG antitoxin of type II toxin-antitoxin system
MSDIQIPKTDSIEELARFWDAHDVTDFQGELEEVPEPVFDRDTVTVRLQPNEAKTVQQLAKSKGLSEEKLLHIWISEKIESARCEQS